MEKTSTQLQLGFTAALAAEGLLDAVTARQDRPIDPTVDDPTRPILLAVSGNGPQMTSGSTREFRALCAIAPYFGRPGTPADQAWIPDPVRAHQGRLPAPACDPRPEHAASRTRHRPQALQSTPTKASATSPPATNTTDDSRLTEAFGERSFTTTYTVHGTTTTSTVSF